MPPKDPVSSAHLHIAPSNSQPSSVGARWASTSQSVAPSAHGSDSHLAPSTSLQPSLVGRSLVRSFSYHPLSNTDAPHRLDTFSQTSDGIRDNTLLLSDMPLPTPSLSSSPAIARSLGKAKEPLSPPFLNSGSPIYEDVPNPFSPGPKSPSPRSFTGKDSSGGTTPKATSPTNPNPSALSLLLARAQQESIRNPPLSQPERPSLLGQLPPSVVVSEAPSYDTTPRAINRADRDLEAAPLLGSESPPLPSYVLSDSSPTDPPLRGGRNKLGSSFHSVATAARKVTSREALAGGGLAVLQALPAVILGLLLNILDGVSYGMIMFPAGAIFDGFGGLGVSMFFVSTIIAQLVYSFGGSSFAGGNGSMMIEVVPFFHILVSGIIEEVGEENPKAVIATTMAAFSFSAILTGITFFLLGSLRLGVLIGFFPRHILVGCIGGVGVFLIETGLEVAASMNEEGGFQYNLETFKFFFLNSHVLSLWVPALTLAVILRIITSKYHHQLIFPMYFLAIPVLFYIVVAITGVDLQTLRAEGWVFEMGEADEPWWKFYTYFDFRETSWKALWVTLPTQFAMLFFNILHPPLNVPALAVSLDHDVDTNKELVAHGYSNLLAGFLGSIPNYLVYVNTLLFYRVGGGTRLAGFMLAAGTALLLFIGTAPIAFIPIMVVAALIFVLGIDLVKEALWDTRHRVSRFEYITIVSIMVCMTLWDFVVGVLFGIVLACFFFVVQNSQRRSIRALYTGDTAMSTVRRPSAHRAYLQEVAKQTMIMKLQGALFFGTITYVEDTVRDLLDTASWKQNPIRFLIMDLTLVGTVDLSAAEAFVRLHRMLSAKGVIFVLCGCTIDSPVGKALASVDLFQAESVELFANIHDALEWTENAYLRAWLGYFFQKIERPVTERTIALPGRQKAPFSLGESFENTPRRSHLLDIGGRIIPDEISAPISPPLTDSEPLNTLVKAFSGYSHDVDVDFFRLLARYLKPISVSEGTILWRKGDAPDGLYIIGSGVLRATYTWNNAEAITESMVAGTLAGELTALSGSPRNTTVVAERQSLLWRLSTKDLETLEAERPETARKFVKLILKVAKMDFDVLIAACSRI